MAGKTALKFWQKKARLDLAIKVIQHEAQLQMASFQGMITHFDVVLESIDNRLRAVEANLNEVLVNTGYTFSSQILDETGVSPHEWGFTVTEGGTKTD